LICDYFCTGYGFGFQPCQAGFDGDCIDGFLRREDFSQKLLSGEQCYSAALEQLHYISNNKGIAVAVYREIVMPFTAEGDMVDGLIAVENFAEQNFADLKFRWFYSSRGEYFFDDRPGRIAEDLDRRYGTCSLAGHYCCESIHIELNLT
jgi:hypothetical protein